MIVPNVAPLLLQFAEARTHVHSLPGSDGAVQLDLAVGVGALAADVLRHTPPSPLEIEQAIEIVEEAVMPAHALLPKAMQLICTDPQLGKLSSKELSAQYESQFVANATVQWLGIDAVEQLFNRMVARAEGRPASQDEINVDGASAARLVIVREILHHWRLEGLYVTTGEGG